MPCSLDVYCLVPYRKKPLCEAAPPIEPVGFHREVVFAFKNGRGMSKTHGGHSFEKLLKSIVSTYRSSPLGIVAAETTWIPVQRSGASQPSLADDGDPFPALTLGQQLATHFGGAVANVFTRTSPLTEKRNILAAKQSLRLHQPIAKTSQIVLLDDTYATGAQIASCATIIREEGFTGTIAAFCIGYVVAARKVTELHERKTHWRITWSPRDQRPSTQFIGRWGT